MSTITSVCRAARWSLVPFRTSLSGSSTLMSQTVQRRCSRRSLPPATPPRCPLALWLKDLGADSWLPAIISVESILNEGCTVARILDHGGDATFLGYSSTPTECQRSPRTRLCQIWSGPRTQAYHCLLQLLKIQLLGLDDTMDAVIRSLSDNLRMSTICAIALVLMLASSCWNVIPSAHCSRA